MRIHSLAVRGVLVLALAFSVVAALAWPSHASARPGHRHAVLASRNVPGIWMY
jgi:hypothetical protein